jgi:hypothetical protein
MSQTISIEQARSSSLKGSVAAMGRAAQQARRTAAQTRTAVVIERNGVLEHLHIAATHADTSPIAMLTPSKQDH